jgi:hypothetical protein
MHMNISSLTREEVLFLMDSFSKNGDAVEVDNCILYVETVKVI